MNIPPAFAHQRQITRHQIEHPRSLVLADPGTGKTRSTLDAIAEHRRNGGGRALVLAPKAILLPAWVADARRFVTGLSLVAAFAPATARYNAFRSRADVIVTNHDATPWMLRHPELFDDIDFLIIDESTAYKNPSTQRTKALIALLPFFTRRSALTGWPTPNNLLDIWAQTFLIDDGERLGRNYHKFRHATHKPVATDMGITKWVEREGTREAVADLISDISIRLKLEDCVDLPPQHHTDRTVRLSKKLRQHYEEMENHALCMVDKAEVEAINAVTLVSKLMQIASGAVYDVNRDAQLLDTERYDLIAQLCAEREHTLVAFQWKHQREGLVRALERIGINEYALIDGEHNRNTGELVERFQSGDYRVLLAQPQSASHGLTFTRAKTIIWASPTWNAEHFYQFNRRIYRIGQNSKTEIIRIIAEDTIDERVYEALSEKTNRSLNLLHLLYSMRRRAA